MPKVHILPPEIISKIAAGEVIDRPASLIKELLENAFDAGTNSITLSVEDAGKRLIRLKDTGSGIAREDMETIFHRHATSKISSLEDLFAIHSLGFRGEALYSIAAVSDVVLRSKTLHDETGWEIHVRGGEKKDFRPCAFSQGTQIEVKELFFNTPARRKFLKSNTGEIHQILNILLPYTLLFPSCRFLFNHQDKTLLDLSASDSVSTRAAAALNLDEKDILTAEMSYPEHSFSLKMLLGNINIIRPRRDLQFIFVNNRPVLNKNISFHLNDVYRLILPSSHYSFFTLFIEVPDRDVDVNIHPTKREVKIKDEQLLCSLIRQLAEKTLMGTGQAKEVFEKDIPKASPSTMPPPPVDAHQKDSLLRDSGWDSAWPADRTHAIPPTEQYAFAQMDARSLGEAVLSQKQDSFKARLSQGRYIGSFLKKFLLFEAGASILIIDQHAGQERITFEQLIRQMQKGQMEVQHLLTPFLLKLSPQEILIWEEAKEVLDEIGFATTAFDDETLAIHSYPVLLKNPEMAVREILSGGQIARADHETLARRACRASVMSGDVLNAAQAEFMREQLMQCQDPFTCPHGRPTVVEITAGFLDKQFLRT